VIHSRALRSTKRSHHLASDTASVTENGDFKTNRWKQIRKEVMLKVRPKLKHALTVVGVSAAFIGGGTAAAFALSSPSAGTHAVTTSTSSSSSETSPASKEAMSPPIRSSVGTYGIHG
jgi:hypothetical protein